MLEFGGKKYKLSASTASLTGESLMAVSFFLTLNLKGEVCMNLIFKIITIATLSFAASIADAPTSLTSDDAQLEEPAGSCCSNYCGDDKECYRWCIKFGQNGPCPNS